MMDVQDRDNGGRGECLQLWRNDVSAMLDLPPDKRQEACDVLFKWFANGDEPQSDDGMVVWFVRQIANRQKRAAEAFARKRDAQSQGGKSAMQKRWSKRADKLVISSDKLVSNENENETITKTETKRNENGTPQAATASPPLSDSVVSVEIETAAQRLGDCSPSRDKWRRFMQTHGAPAFRAMVDKVAAAQGVAKRGAYLNRLLDTYAPAPPPAPKPKPREWTRKDWCLCEERCAHFDACAARCSKGITTPPGNGKYQYPPEECEHYKALDSAERDARVGDTLSSLAGDIAKGMCARAGTSNRERIAV